MRIAIILVLIIVRKRLMNAVIDNPEADNINSLMLNLVFSLLIENYLYIFNFTFKNNKIKFTLEQSMMH